MQLAGRAIVAALVFLQAGLVMPLAAEARHAYQTYVPSEADVVYEEVPSRPQKKKKPKKEKKKHEAPAPPVVKKVEPKAATSFMHPPAEDTSDSNNVKPPSRQIVPDVDTSKVDSVNADDAYKKGKELFENKDYLAAITKFDDAIKANPDYTDAYLKRGKCYAEKKDFEGAVQDFSRAITLDYKNGEAYRERGLARAELGLKSESQSDLDQAKSLGVDVTANSEPASNSSSSSTTDSSTKSSTDSKPAAPADPAKENLTKRIMISLAMLFLICLYWMFFGVFALKGPQTKPWQTARFALMIVGLAITTGLGLMSFASMLSVFKTMF